MIFLLIHNKLQRNNIFMHILVLYQIRKLYIRNIFFHHFYFAYTLQRSYSYLCHCNRHFFHILHKMFNIIRFTIIFFKTAIEMKSFESSNLELVNSPSKRNGLGPLPPINSRKVGPIKEDVHPDDFELVNTSNTGKLLIIRPESANEEVPVVKISKTTTSLTLISKNKGKGGSKENIPDVIARGIICGNNNVDADLSGDIDFRGNFKGSFEEELAGQRIQMIYYFQGEITDLKILRINGQKLSQEKQLELEELTNFKGYFKGFFIPIYALSDNLEVKEQFGVLQQQDLYKALSKKSKPKVEYHLPTLVRFDVRKISQINMEKSSALISAILYIDVQLSQEVLPVVYDIQNDCFRKKYKLAIDFHRSKPLVLPFYNQEDFDETDQEEQYEWDDVWEGIDMEAEWKKDQLRMSYYIKMQYTAEIDNSHGIFYAPFNLNMLRIIVDLHAIKVDGNTKLCLNCCEMTDFNPTRSYTPYTFFQNLNRNLDPNLNLANRQSHTTIYQRHIDRLTKIDVTHFEDQGEFKIANNRLSLFPYHRRVLRNKNQLTSDIRWTLGTASRTALLQTPIVRSVREGYYHFIQKGESEMFDPKEWEFVHIQLPIYKYPVIDMIRIFVPILILSAISMTIFEQENAKDFNNFTQLAKRIASGCNLMIAYVALIPMIRTGLPPTPSVTLVQILIYLSVIPNFLAIISVFFCDYAGVLDFFANYQPFVDGLFLASFVICCLSFIALLIVMLIYAKKDYKSDYTINKFKPSPLCNLRAPTFLTYVSEIRDKRKDSDIEVKEFAVPYRQLEENDSE